MTTPFTAAPKSTVWGSHCHLQQAPSHHESNMFFFFSFFSASKFSWQCVSLNMIKTSRSPPLLFSSPPSPPLLFLTHTNSSDLREYGDDDEDHQDTTVNQMLVPRSHQEDATLILNNLLKEYDKTLRPDIGGKDQKWWGGVGGFFGWRRNFGDAVQGLALCLSCPWCWN